MGMAFTDELLTRTQGYTVLLVDNRAQPGGHWNDAYPYVRLHQPSVFYGVNSMKLEREPPRSDGNNELASGQEVLAYYQRVLRRFQELGRVRHMPMCEADESGRRVTSLVEPGRTWEVRVRRKVVDSTYMKVEVPATKAPRYKVAQGALLVPPNCLPSIAKPHAQYVVIGAGKTGMDAVLWLLKHGVPPERLKWVMPRDPWMLNRGWIQPGIHLQQMQKIELLTLGEPRRSAEETALLMEEQGLLLRVDESRQPEAYQCATVSQEELLEMRRVIPGIIRLGHVQEVGVERLLLDRGEVETGEGTLHVDCTADALAKRPAVPIFSEGRITLQSVSMCQQVASAAQVAWVEAKWPDDDAKKNHILTPCPHPDGFQDFSVCDAISAQNAARFASEGGLGYTFLSRLSIRAHESKLSLIAIPLRVAWAKLLARPLAKL